MQRNLFIVDDDEAVSASLHRLLARQSGNRVRTFRSGNDFLEHCPALDQGVVLLDYHMSGANGLRVLEALRAFEGRFVTVMLTAHGAVQRSVDAMKSGAFDFLEKPYDAEALLDCIEAAFRRLDLVNAGCATRDAARRQMAELTRREHQVLEGMVQGRANKQIAGDLKISPRTVEIYRANVMQKLHATTLAEVLQVVFAAEPARAA